MRYNYKMSLDIVKEDIKIKNDDESFETKEVKYELNTVENLKKAKDNVNRSESTTRIITDDENIRFELNSGVYLEVKKKSQNLKKGDEFVDKDIGVKLKVTSVRKAITKIKKDSPQASIYYEVKAENTNDIRKVVQHMYHTKQVVHLQGGGRLKNTTSTSLVAYVLERQWAKIKEEKHEAIAKYNDSIKTLDLGKFAEDLCDYKSTFYHEMERHMIKIHKSKSLLAKKGKRIFYDSDSKQEDGKRVKELGFSATSSAASEEGPHEQAPAATQVQGVQQEMRATTTTPELQEQNPAIIQFPGLQELEERCRLKDERIQDLEDQLKVALSKLTAAENQSVNSNNQRENAITAMKKVIKDKSKVEDDYQEVAAQLGSATRNIVELEEELKVTNDICKALEIDFEEREELEIIRKKKEENTVVVLEEDEADLVEDISTGHLHPTKVEKRINVSQTSTNHSSNACKKCDVIISDKEDFLKHMKSHIRNEKIKLKYDYCDFESHEGNELLNHVSEIYVKFHKCRTCARVFVNNEDLVAHVVKEHSFMKGNSADKCTVCGEEFLSVDPFIHHILRVHHLVNEETLVTTEAGIQLERVMPTPSAAGFKCYDCNKDVGERSNLMKHKREDHYKQRMCKRYHENNYCRFSPRECVYIHQPEERQWQNTGMRQSREVQGTVQPGGGEGIIPCKNGPGCSWLANNRCRFKHETTLVRNVVSSPSSPVINVSQLPVKLHLQGPQ